MSSREDVHRLVDELDESMLQDAARRLAELRQRNRASAVEAETEAAVTELRQRHPWIGSMRSGRSDLSERSEEVLRDEFGRHVQ